MKTELIELAESLETAARKAATAALILAMRNAVAKRFRAQSRLFRAAGLGHLAAAFRDGKLRDIDVTKAVSSLSDVEVANFARRYATWTEKAAAAGAEITAAELGIERAASAAELGRTAEDLLTEIDRTTKNGVESIIRKGFEEGLSRGEMQRQVGDLFNSWSQRADDSRAGRIGLNEISTAFHAGMVAAAPAGSLKEWLTDSDPCPICEANAGEQIPLDEPFESGEDAPPQHINCRCSLRIIGAESTE